MEATAESFAAKMRELAAGYNADFRLTAAAVSGGADSLALAFLLKDFQKQNGGRAAVLTVNHHLRPEADAEAAMVVALMKKWGIEHHVLNWFPEEGNGGIEEKAREARYRLMEDWCVKNGFYYLLTAHHQQDQAETFLMRLQRGSGVDGLSAMAEMTPRGKICVVRPLLEAEPAALRRLLRENGIAWAEDASNGCDDFLRVRIRKFLPELEKKTGLRNVVPVVASLMAKGAVEVSEELKRGFVPKMQTFIRLAEAYKEEEKLQAVFADFKRAKKQEHLLISFLELSHALNPALVRELSKKELLESKGLYDLFFRYIREPFHPLFRYVQEHQDEFKAQYDPQQLDDKLYQVWSAHASDFFKQEGSVYKIDEEGLKRYFEEMTRFPLFKGDEIMLRNHLLVAEYQRDWNKYAQICNEAIRKQDVSDGILYNWASRIGNGTITSATRRNAFPRFAKIRRRKTTDT